MPAFLENLILRLDRLNGRIDRLPPIPRWKSRLGIAVLAVAVAGGSLAVHRGVSYWNYIRVPPLVPEDGPPSKEMLKIMVTRSSQYDIPGQPIVLKVGGTEYLAWRQDRSDGKDGVCKEIYAVKKTDNPPPRALFRDKIRWPKRAEICSYYPTWREKIGDHRTCYWYAWPANGSKGSAGCTMWDSLRKDNFKKLWGL